MGQIKRIAISGAGGFLGWHTACRLRALSDVHVVSLGRQDFDNPSGMRAKLEAVDAVIHIAGVNRAASEADVERGNIELARVLAEQLKSLRSPAPVVFANSVQALQDNPYGRGKAAASGLLAEAAQLVGSPFADVLLPNLFGEHGQPYYNSFVATFAHAVQRNEIPSVTADRPIPLLHVQDAAARLIEAVGSTGREEVRGEARLISEVLRQLREIHERYAKLGEIPSLQSRYDVNLFNTYRAAAFPTMWPVHPMVHRDGRGHLFETVRAHGGTGQTFVSSTLPGQARGNHYHIHKVERFCVISGEAEIRLRRLLHDDIVSFRVSGDSPCFIDMPTLWTHSIRNVGASELITMFWADQLLNPEDPDQYPEEVDAT